MNHLVKKYVENDAISEANKAILQLMQPTNMTPLQYNKALFLKAFYNRDVYDEGTTNSTYIEKYEELIRHSFRSYWTTHSQIDLIDLSFYSQSQLDVNSGLSKQTHRHQTPTGRDAIDKKKKVSVIDSVSVI